MSTKVNGTKVNGRIGEIWGLASMANIFVDEASVECKIMRNGKVIE